MSGLTKTMSRTPRAQALPALRQRVALIEGAAEEAEKVKAGRFSIIPRPTLPEAGKQRILFPIVFPETRTKPLDLPC